MCCSNTQISLSIHQLYKYDIFNIVKNSEVKTIYIEDVKGER